MGRAEMEFEGMKLIAEGIEPGVFNEGGPGQILRVAGRKVVVEKEQILVDGVTKSKIPPDTKSIRAVSRDGDVVVEIDGKEAFRLRP
jgi:hypothetical protein